MSTYIGVYGVMLAVQGWAVFHGLSRVSAWFDCAVALIFFALAYLNFGQERRHEAIDTADEAKLDEARTEMNTLMDRLKVEIERVRATEIEVEEEPDLSDEETREAVFKMAREAMPPGVRCGCQCPCRTPLTRANVVFKVKHEASAEGPGHIIGICPSCAEGQHTPRPGAPTALLH